MNKLHRSRLPQTTHTISDAVSDNSPNIPSFTLACTARINEMAQQPCPVIAFLTNHMTFKVKIKTGNASIGYNSILQHISIIFLTK